MQKERRFTKKQVKRRGKIIDASMMVLSRDLEINLDKIIIISGGSKGAIYEFFGNKQGLEEAVAEEIMIRVEMLISKVMKDLDGVIDGNNIDGEKFKIFVRNLFKALYVKKSLEAMRLMFNNFSFHQKFVGNFYEDGPLASINVLAAFFERVAEKEGIVIRDPKRCAVVVLGMVLAPFFLDVIFKSEQKYLNEEDLEAHADWVSTLLMKGFPKGILDMQAL